MSKELATGVFERAIAVEGCRFSKTALVIDRVDDATLVQAGAFLQTVESCSAWWWGDFLVAYCQFRLDEDEADRGSAYDEIVREERLVRYAAHYAEIAKVEVGTLHQRKDVCAFFKPCTRVQGLTFTHHRIAKWGSDGDLAVAQEWLRIAEAKQWKPSQLKAAIKAKGRKDDEPDEPMPQMVLPMEYVEARRRATHDIARVDELSVDQAKALLAELEPVMAYAKALLLIATHSAANTAGSPLAAASLPRGKESLPRAA